MFKTKLSDCVDDGGTSRRKDQRRGSSVSTLGVAVCETPMRMYQAGSQPSAQISSQRTG